MSHDIALVENGASVSVKAHCEGGTYVAGGNPRAELNVTYNYGWFYYKFLDSEKGIQWLYGKKAKDCIERLEKAILELHNPPCFGSAESKGDESYWSPTPSNASRALEILLSWAKEHPEAIFEGD